MPDSEFVLGRDSTGKQRTLRLSSSGLVVPELVPQGPSEGIVVSLSTTPALVHANKACSFLLIQSASANEVIMLAGPPGDEILEIEPGRAWGTVAENCNEISLVLVSGSGAANVIVYPVAS